MKTASILAVAAAFATASAQTTYPACDSSVLQSTQTNADAKLCNTAVSPYVLKSLDLKTDPTILSKLCATPSCNTFLAFFTSKQYTECSITGRTYPDLNQLIAGYVNPVKDACFGGKQAIRTCDASEVAAYSTDADAKQCSTDIGFDLSSLATPSSTYIKLICKSSACMNFVTKFGPTVKSECITPGAGQYRLQADFINAVATTCGTLAPTTAPTTTATPTTAPPTTAPATTAPATTAPATTAPATTAPATTAPATTAPATTATPTVTPCGTLPMPNVTTAAPTTAAPATAAPSVTPCGTLPMATTPAPTTAKPTVTPCGTLPMPTPAPTNNDYQNYQRPMC